MMLRMRRELMAQIARHGEEAYPEEGAGFLLGRDGPERSVQEILTLGNAREGEARHNRYLIQAEDYLQAELYAEEHALEIIGVFHSHPDHPDRPSEYDREWAQPRFSYLITSVEAGRAAGSRCWCLADDRTQFSEEEIQIE